MRGWIERAWYTPRWWDVPLLVLLLPLSLLFCLLAILRRQGYRSGWLSSTVVDVPLLVVGNITVGGTGKTPLVIALVRWAQQQGYSPAVVSRGYGRKDERQLLKVEAASDPQQVGDEPLLIAQQSGAPVYVSADRPLAAQRAVAEGADLVISDDGLQHYRMQRDIELVVMDGARQLGNGLCLPAGPLRERASRLQQVDAVVVQGAGEYAFQLQPKLLYRLSSPQEQIELDALSGQQVHAVAGIGNPQRFFSLLNTCGIEVIPHPFTDHHQYNGQEIIFDDTLPVLMTEKDAVKCAALEQLPKCLVWVVPVEAELSQPLQQLLENRLKQVNQNGG